MSFTNLTPFVPLKSIAIPFDRDGIDTDSIIPKQFLKGVGFDGLGEKLFFDWRYLEADFTQPNPDFILNDLSYAGARILVCGTDFGVGSSREHAVIALKDFGFQCLIAPSFGDIFYNNCLKNGVLPAITTPTVRDALLQAAHKKQPIAVDLPSQSFTLTHTAEQQETHWFDIAPHAKQYLLAGMDDISRTLQDNPSISQFEQAHHQRFPWLLDS